MASAREIIAALGGNEHNGMCRCPVHDDKQASLHVSVKDGKVLVHCFAGCLQESVIDWLKARDLWESKEKGRMRNYRNYRNEEDDEPGTYRQALAILRAAAGFDGNRRKWGKPPDYKGLLAPYLNGRGINTVPENAMWLPAAEADKLTNIRFPAMVLPIKGAKGVQGVQVTYLTRSGDGNLRGKDGKNIRRFYGSSKGGYIQLGKFDPDKPVAKLGIAESVEDALSGSQITGLPAISALSASNMPNVQPPPCSEAVILADNDDAGKVAADQLAHRLTNSGCLVRIAIPEPDNPTDEKYDWNEALNDALKDGTDFGALREDILSVKPVPKLERPEHGYAISAVEFMDIAFPPREYIIEPWLETGSLAMLFSKRGIGKTRFMMSVAYAIGRGERFLDWNIAKARRVLYVDGELPGTLMQQRLKVHGISEQISILSRDVLLRSHRVNIPDLATPEGREFLDREITDKQAEVVILDSLSTLIKSGVENDAESWSPVQEWLLDLRLRGVTVIFIHHEGKAQTQRGTSKREDPLDTIVRLKETKSAGESEANDTCEFELHFVKYREFTGAARAPRLVRLSTKSGQAEWSYEALRDHQHEQIKQLHRLGQTQQQIAKELDIDQSTVSRALTKGGVKGRKKQAAENPA
jgi:hypothetical protein